MEKLYKHTFTFTVFSPYEDLADALGYGWEFDELVAETGQAEIRPGHGVAGAVDYLGCLEVPALNLAEYMERKGADPRCLGLEPTPGGPFADDDEDES